MDRLRDFIDDLREHWDDDYWWARHQVFRASLVAIIVGAIGLFFTYLETRVQRSALGET